MKLKEINRTASVAWSPIQSCPAICTGTMAGTLDESFSNTTELEIFKLDWANKEDGSELKPAGVVASNARFNRLAWSAPTTEHSLGVIVGGMENGELDFWDPEKILKGESAEKSLISRQTKHSGAVRGLDFNPIQTNLLASGACDGEIFIWNLGDLTKPYTPGNKSPKLDEITCLAWNKRVQHILATSSNSGYTVIWDLKHRREVMSLGYQPNSNQGFGTNGPRGVTAVAWNPDSPTQLVTASEDDNNPIVMLWDLRNANAPEKVFSGHSKGVLSLSWCSQDSDLLLSCGKDNRTICWNPKLGEIVGEFPQSNNWSFDVQFSPRNPTLLSSSSYDGKVAIYSLLSSPGEAPAQASESDPFSQAIASTTAFALKSPPKWFRRPVGATFGFGGQLAYFGATEGQHNVTLANVSVETQVLQRSDDLENALTTDTVEEYCEKQASSASGENDKITWDVLRLLFKEDSRNQLVQMLGVERNVSKNETEAVLKSLGIKPTVTEEPTVEEPQETQTEAVEEPKENEVNSFFQEEGQEKDDFFSQTPKKPEAAPEPILATKPFKINGDTSSMEGLLSKMVVIGDFSGAVDLCLQTTRYADALILAMCGGDDLLTKTKKEVFRLRRDEASYVRLLENVIEGNFLDVVQNADLAEWQKIVAMICTYAQGEEFSRLMETLGSRLHKSAEPGASQNALMCFLLAGNMARVVEIWVGDGQTPRSMDSLQLQSLIEKVAIFSKAIDFTVQDDSLALLYMVYYQYASLLASQGYMHTAAKYLSLIPSSHQGPTLFSLDDFSALKYRLYYAGVEVDSIDPSVYPYTPAEIGAPAYEAPQQAFQPAQQQTYQQSQPTYQQAQPTYQPAQATYPSAQAPFQATQQPFYGGSYQQPAPYVPEPPQATASPYDMTALYNPYPNYPPTNLPAAATQQEVAPPPSAQKGGPAWNDPPSEVFATKQAPARAQAKAPIMSPFSNSTSANAPPTQQPYQPFNTSALPPPPQGGRAPAPLYRSSPAPARPPPQQGVRQMSQPPAPQPGMPTMPQPGMPQQPPMHQQGMPQQPMQRPPPRPSAPAQRPLYQTSPAPPTQAPRGNLPGPGTPHPNMGMSQPPRPQQSVISPTPTPPKSQPAPMDRSKMPPKYKQVFDQLSKSLAAVKSAGFPPAQQRMVMDVDRRMTMLFDAMNSDQLHASLAGLLAEYGQALEAKDYPKALNFQSDMVNRHVDQVGTWVLGLKHIVTLLRSMN